MFDSSFDLAQLPTTEVLLYDRASDQNNTDTAPAPYFSDSHYEAVFQHLPTVATSSGRTVQHRSTSLRLDSEPRIPSDSRRAQGQYVQPHPSEDPHKHLWSGSIRPYVKLEFGTINNERRIGIPATFSGFPAAYSDIQNITTIKNYLEQHFHFTLGSCALEASQVVAVELEYWDYRAQSRMSLPIARADAQWTKAMWFLEEMSRAYLTADILHLMLPTVTVYFDQDYFGACLLSANITTVVALEYLDPHNEEFLAILRREDSAAAEMYFAICPPFSSETEDFE